MPIYEYRCEACGHQFDEMILGREPEPTICPSCGKAQIVRAMSAPAFKLKGSGWYVTDYGKAGSDAKASETSTSQPSESDESASSIEKSTSTEKGAEAGGSSSEAAPSSSEPEGPT